MEPLDRALFASEEMRAVLAARDIGTVYRHLRRLGISQRHIAQLTGQSQSEVSEILRGRQVSNVWLLERIAAGLGIPRAWLGVSYGEEPAEESPAEEEVDEAVKRRTLIATATAVVVGQALGLGKPVKLPLPAAEQVLPARLGMSDVQAVRAVTEQLRGVARYYGGQAGAFRGVVATYTPWLGVPATEEVTAALAAVLADLHTEAGWACNDEGLDGTAFFTRALSLAGEYGDTYGIVNAAENSGLTLVRSGYPNDALKLFQLGRLRLSGFQPGRSRPAARAEDPRLPALAGYLNLHSATAWALMKAPEEATRCLAEAHEGWEFRDAFGRAAGDCWTAAVQLDLGQVEAAERSVTSALRGYGETHRRGRIQAELLRAEVHVRAGEPQGLSLAHHAIEAVSTLRSTRVRRERLLPLATALDARPGTETRELAQTAWQVAAGGPGPW